MTKNIYQDWKDKNVLKEKLTLIEKLASNGVSEERIADILGISTRYNKKLKEKNKDFAEAHDRGRGNFKQSRIDNIIKVANGGRYTKKNTYIEETPRGITKRMVEIVEELPPNFGANKYLLTIYFGKEFSDRKFELDLAEKRIEKENEVWFGGNNTEEDIGIEGVRKQSEK